MTNQYRPVTCDKCGRQIKMPEAGILEFICDIESGKCYGLQVVHHLSSSPLACGCGYHSGRLSISNKAVGDDSLNYYTGPYIEDRLDLLKGLLDFKDPSEIEKLKSRLVAAGYANYIADDSDLN